MIFPKRIPVKVLITTEIIKTLGIEPLEVNLERDLYVVVKNEEIVQSFVPDYNSLQNLERWLVILITEKG